MLVSRSYFEVVSHLRENSERLFRPLGVFRDKHVREHQVYALNTSARAFYEKGAQASDQIGALEPLTLAPTDEDLLALAESKLTELIGPLASVVVTRARKTSDDIHFVLHQMSTSIADENDRAAFLAEFTQSHQTAASGEPRSHFPSECASVQDEQVLAEIERQLVDYMGPMAKILINKISHGVCNIDELCNELASHIDNADARQKFLAAVREVHLRVND